MKKILGKVHIKIVCADQSYLLTQISKQGIILYQIKQDDLLTLQAYVSNRQLSKLIAWLDRYGIDYKVLSDNRFLSYWRRLRSRSILIIGCVFFVVVTVLLPQYVWFIFVEGNQFLSDRDVLDAAHSCGFHLGMRRKDIRSERFKNDILDMMPQLEWIGINTRGCYAKIKVKERENTVPNEKETAIVGNIIAAYDGIVLSCTAEKGNLLVRPGQAVQAGEILISGYTDCGIILQASKPEGEIIARTVRQLTAVTPRMEVARQDAGCEERRYGLRIGKKLIKFYKDSGISDSSCVKMYSEEYWELPGGYQLPIAWTTETLFSCQTIPVDISEKMQQDALIQCASDYIVTQMIAGEQIDMHPQYTMTEACGILSCQFICRESIGIYTNEEIMQEYGQSD